MKNFSPKVFFLLPFLFITLLGSDAMARSHHHQRSNQLSPTALVWAGPGACKEDCALAAGNIAKGLGFIVKYVYREDITSENLANASLWVQPGGDAIVASRHLGLEKLAMIREYVRNGGRYIGFCAGAFLVDKWIDHEKTIPGLGISPVTTDDYAIKQLGNHEVMLDMNWNGAKRTVYFSEGATFFPETGRGVNVFAYFNHPPPLGKIPMAVVKLWFLVPIPRLLLGGTKRPTQRTPMN